MVYYGIIKEHKGFCVLSSILYKLQDRRKNTRKDMIKLIEKFDRLDKTVMSKEDYIKISRWTNENRKEDDIVNFPMEEGLVVTKEYYEILETTLEQITYFKISDSGITIKSYDAKDMYEVLSFTINDSYIEKGEFAHLDWYKNMRITREEVKKQAHLMISLLFNVFYYMSNAPQTVREKKDTKTIVKKQKNKKKTKSNKSRYVKISTSTYSFDNSQSDDKRAYERSAEMWTVRGHWRYYKSTGKRVWVKPHVKGIGENLETKEYRM